MEPDNTVNNYWTCALCSKPFLTQNELSAHYNVCQSSSTRRANVCASCQKTFRDSHNLRRHERVCKGKKNDTSKVCKLCGKEFRNCYDLKRHGLACEKKNNKGSPKDVSRCNTCDKIFRNAYDLGRHKSKCKSHHKSRNGGSLREAAFTCSFCQKNFMSVRYLKQHLKACAKAATAPNENNMLYNCVVCRRGFHTVLSLKDHTYKHKRERRNYDYKCGECGQIFSSTDELHEHIRLQHRDSDSIDSSGDSSDNEMDNQEKNTRYNGNLVIYTIRPNSPEERCDLLHFLAVRRQRLRDNLMHELRRLKFVKWNICAVVKMVKYDQDGNVKDEDRPSFRSVTCTTISENVLNSQIDEAFFKIGTSLDSFRKSGSGWVLDKVLKLDQTIIKYNPLRGMADCVMLPYVLASKMCLLNVYDTPVNEPESCFKWAVITSMHSTPGSFGDISWKDFAAHRHALDFSCIKGGERRVALSDIPVFEKKNKLSVNVLGYETCFIPLYVSENAKHKNWPRVNLLMFESDGLEGPLVHYCAIKDMSRLVGSQIYSGNRKHFFCFRCLVSFQTKDNLSDHERHCQLFAPARTVFPKVENKWVRFKNFKNQLPVSFMIVAEFQCYVQKITDLNEPTEGPVVRERKFEPCAWTYMRVSANDAYPSAPVMYRGKDPKDTMQRFLMAMEEEERYVFNILHNKKVPIALEETGLANLAQTTDICHICEDTFLPGETKVVDHSHTTGLVRGFAHQSCNLNFKEASFLPILIENLGTNEGRLIMSAIGHYGSSNVSVIAQNGDNFISIKVNRCRYLDTRRFLDCSLGSLVEDTAASRGLDGFRYVRKYVQPDSTDLFTKELHFCHEHFDGPERLHERECPGEKGFYDVTTDRGIDSESYKVVLELWKKMEFETLENFLETYLMGRVLQLADIITNLRESLLFDFKLDPIHYFSISGFAWDSALKWSKVDLELITSSEMYLFVEASMRGGLASIGSPRFARANNDTMPEGEFDPTEPLSYMHYFDFNGLYASVMRDFALPTHGYRWLTEEEKEKVNLQDIDESSELGYLIECDLEYPSELHNEHDSFPLAPEYTDVIEEEMSAYTKDMAKSMGIDIGNCGKKLLTTLRPKTKYVVHYVNLKLYLQLGMKMTEVHRVLQFKQSKWLSDYVSMLTEKRRLTLSSVNGKLYKTIACAVYGSSILELSKARVYDFFYKQLLRMFPTKLGWRTDLLMCDTDALLVRVTGNGKVNETLQQNSHLFDFSNLPETHPLRNDTNRKVPGKIKLELGSRVCYEFAGLSAKCYSISTDSNSKIACKGVKNSSALRHSQYKNCLFDSITHIGQHRGVRSYNLQLYQTSVRKRQLNPFDPKRFYVNKLLSHSFGHWKIAEVTELPVRNLVAEFPDEGGDDVIVISDDEMDQTLQESTSRSVPVSASILDSSDDVPVMRQLYNGTDCWHNNQLEEDTCDACSSKTAAASGLQ